MSRAGLFVLSGPSGAGKGTLVSRIVSELPHIWVSVSATTRKPRPNEVDGVHYFFKSDAEFDRLIEEDGFLEWAQVHDCRYGTLAAEVESHRAAGISVILEIDVQGAFQVREKVPDATLIFIDPPSLEELERRLRHRGTESEDVIQKRMRTAEVEISHKMEYDYTLVNEDLDEATRSLVSIIENA